MRVHSPKRLFAGLPIAALEVPGVRAHNETKNDLLNRGDDLKSNTYRQLLPHVHKRPTRLSLRFSKELENLAAAVALHGAEVRMT